MNISQYTMSDEMMRDTISNASLLPSVAQSVADAAHAHDEVARDAAAPDANAEAA